MRVHVRHATLVLLAGALVGGTLTAPATAATTCAGRTATVVGTAAGETLHGTAGDDVIAAGGGDDTVLAGAGDDVVCGEDGADIVRGGNGADVLRGGDGDDQLYGELDALVENRASGLSRIGDDLYGGLGDDRLDAGADTRESDAFALDTIHYDLAEAAVRVDLGAGSATGQGADTIAAGTLQVYGSAFGDDLVGSPRTDVLQGGAGPDTLRGAAGEDFLYPDDEGGPADADVVRGGADRDVILAFPGADLLVGGAGNDTLQDAGRSGADRLRGGAGDDRVIDLLVDASGQWLRGGTGRNILGLGTAFGEARPPGLVDLGAERAAVRWQGRAVVVGVRDFRVVHLPDGAWDFRGTAGPDTAYGRIGPNRLYGRGGDDRLEGSPRDDLIDGGAGYDTAQPRGGTDTCRSVEAIRTPSQGVCDRQV
jgi:Ca2+-binding RTX toxin-like protein